MTAMLRALVVVLLSTVGLAACRESAEEKLARLEAMGRGADREDALEEISSLLTEKNKELSEPIDEDNVDRILKQSADGKTIAWAQDDDLYVREADRVRHIDLDAPISDFTLSGNGRFAAALTAAESECKPVVIDVIERRTREIEAGPVACFRTPAISGDGALLFLPEKNGLRLMELESGQSRQIPASKTPAKFRNLSNLYAITTIGERSALVFFGAAGYYDLYYYSGDGGDLKRLLQNVARPRFFPSTDGVRLESAEELPSTAVTEDRLNLAKADGFVYSGGAGRWQLHPLQLGDEPRLGRALPAPAFQQLVFVRNRGEFLIHSRERLYYWNPYSRKKRALPLAARRFEMGAEGLIYVDLLNRLYLRRAPFSELEIQLTQLRESISAEDSAADTVEPRD